MTWDDGDFKQGRFRRTIQAASSQGSVLVYRFSIAVITTVCASLSGLVFNGFLEQGRQISAIAAIDTVTEERLKGIENTISVHTDKINAAKSQEEMDAIQLQNQIQQIVEMLDKHDHSLINIAPVIRLRGPH